MLVKLKSYELFKIIPGVATGSQFSAALGNPRKILQRVMLSSIGGVITLVISQSMVTSQFYALWLILGVVFLLYILWGPILEASRKNSKLRDYPFCAIFEGQIDEIYTKDKIENSHEQADTKGELELVQNRRTWLYLALSDEDGYLGDLSFPLDKKHQLIREGMVVRCVVFSNNRDFSSITNISDAWIPQIKFWVGEYPYLLRPAFEELCAMRFRRNS
tara:strand:+ start:485 stop:1138 length:654 start_codon:yes stop_codon:yes gene_type:complete